MSGGVNQRPDRRGFGRRKTVIRAWILITGRRELPCLVRNLSPGGALLDLAVPSWMPFQFQLKFADDGSVVDCEMRHKGENGIGVLFQQPLTREQVHARRGDPVSRAEE